MDDIILSICIPTYNRAQELERQLRFFFDEIDERNEFEIIVTDNSTNEDTKIVTEAFIVSYKYLRYYKNEKNIGLVDNVIKAVELSKGKYVLVLGDDDKFEKGILDYILYNIKNNDNIGALFLNHDFFGPKIANTQSLFKEGAYFSTLNEEFIMDYFTESIHGGFMFISANVIRRSQYLECIKKIHSKNTAFPLIVPLYALINKGMMVLNEVFIHDKLGEVSWHKDRYSIFSLEKLESLVELNKYTTSKHTRNIIKKFINFRTFNKNSIKLLFSAPFKYFKLILILIRNKLLFAYLWNLVRISLKKVNKNV